MKLLGIETSSPSFSVAVSEGPKILTTLQGEGQGRPSSLLTDLIQQSLEKAGLKLPELDGFAISIGPGSFTGLRVGVMTVKTLAWALKKPVLPISSLEVLAHGAGGVNSAPNIHLFLDARKGNVYWAHFRRNGEELQRMSPDELLRPEEALGRIKPPVLMVGDGLRRYAEVIASLKLLSREVPRSGASSSPSGFEQSPASLWIPRADLLCRIAHSRWPAGIVDDPHPLVPQYLYSMESDITGR